MIKKICILTKSYKDNDYCVAGVDMNSSEWVRIVPNSTANNAIPKIYMDNIKNPINIFDVVEIDLIKKVPIGCQTENWLIDVKSPPKKIGNMNLNQLLQIKAYDNYKTIFGDFNSYVPTYLANKLNYSLIFIKVSNIEFEMVRNYQTLKWDRKHITFDYNGNRCCLSVTDPEYKKIIYNGKNYNQGSLIISIPAVPFNGRHYKFVSKVIL